MTQVNIDRVIEGYLQLRQQKEDLAKKHKDEMAPITGRMDKIENYMMAHLTGLGITSVAARDVGTAFIETRTDATVEDWDATFEWIKKTNSWEFLERRVSKVVAKDYVEAHGEVPPGIKLSRELVVRIRKS